jgi:hypothetical protein
MQTPPKMTVLEVAEAAVAACRDDPEGNDLEVAKVLALLDVSGSQNLHLANPLNHPRQGYWRPRQVALSGKEPVHGSYLALCYCAHDPFVVLHDYTDIVALEKFLASNSGPVNPFITYCVAFIEGRVERYRIAHKAVDGAGYFEKQLQNTHGPQPAERAIERWVEWDSAALPSHGC